MKFKFKYILYILKSCIGHSNFKNNKAIETLLSFRIQNCKAVIHVLRSIMHVLRIYRHSEFKIVKPYYSQIHVFTSHIKEQKCHTKIDEKYHKCY